MGIAAKGFMKPVSGDNACGIYNLLVIIGKPKLVFSEIGIKANFVINASANFNASCILKSRS